MFILSLCHRRHLRTFVLLFRKQVGVLLDGGITIKWEKVEIASGKKSKKLSKRLRKRLRKTWIPCVTNWML
jgi:hypothetical protein